MVGLPVPRMMLLRGPLRVRALVPMRWPRTGRPRRWRCRGRYRIHQAFDIHRYLATQVAFDRDAGDLTAQAIDFGLGQVPRPWRRASPFALVQSLCDIGRLMPKIEVRAITTCF